jgi:protein SCO1
MNRRALFANFASNAPREPNLSSTGVERFTNAVLRTHEDRQVRFYDDLIKDKQVIINMMYADCEGFCPTVTANMLKIYQALKDRMGKNLFMYSITLKPEQDDPAALRRFAEMHRALLPGWTFLTGDPYDIETLRFRLFRWDHIKFDLDLDTHAGMLRIINDATDCWTMVTPMASTYTILQHIAWADPPRSFDERFKENKALQEKIDREIKLHGYRRTV